jgi:malonate transporter and related proteins
MLETIAGALLPAIVTVLLGYFAARHDDFAPKDAPILNRMVLTYALPLALFIGTVRTTRAALVKDIGLLIVLSVAILGLYGAVFLVCRFLFRFSLGMCALGALAASAPNGPFIGAVVLGHLYGPASSIVVAISGVLFYLTVVPVTVILVSLEAGQGATESESLPAHLPSPVVPPRVDILRKVVEAVKQPVVWLPLLGFMLVLLGIHVPVLTADSFALLGHAASGVALFASGVILAGYKVAVSGPVLFLVFVKNILQPALVWGAMVWLRYTNPLLGEAVVMAALPMLVLVVMLSVQYQIGERETASALFISTVASLVTMSVFIALVRR